MKVQGTLDAAADRIMTAGKNGNLGSIVINPESRRLLVYWKGEPPSDVRRIANSMSSDLKAEILPAKHSRLELLSSLDVTVKQLAKVGINVTEAAPLSDSSGISVSVLGDLDLAARITSASHPEIPAQIKVGVANSLTREIASSDENFIAPQKTTRIADVPLYWGGALYTYPNPTSVCSTGFGIKQNGLRRMLTAGHCGEDGYVISMPDQSDGVGYVPVGTMSAKDKEHDTILINMPAGDRMYTGGVLSGSSSKVTGAFGTYVGDYVCTSGANSGQHCAGRVSAVDVSMQIQSVQLHGMAVAYGLDDGPMLKSGDSGGPVMQFGLTGVIAKGTITGGGGMLVQCWKNAPSKDCFNKLVFPPITDTLDRYGATLLIENSG
ncbi:S1 family peptidase [Streptomyces sp. NPDC053431]|uniref:S1 family peptidase n=1 Tax=Streptomyces sp. NPDC053431 TaxID=3365703 RepID=UPI0037D8C5E1